MRGFVGEQLQLHKERLRQLEDDSEVRESSGDRVRLGLGQEKYR